MMMEGSDLKYCKGNAIANIFERLGLEEATWSLTSKSKTGRGKGRSTRANDKRAEWGVSLRC
jgi:hypothetical protein